MAREKKDKILSDVKEAQSDGTYKNNQKLMIKDKLLKDIIKLDSGYEIKLINLDIGGAINMNAPKTEEELFNWFKKIVIKDSK